MNDFEGNLAGDIPPKEDNIIKKAVNYGKSIHSRGLDNKIADERLIKLRQLSCLGNEFVELCPQAKTSKKYDGRYICGGCGCGNGGVGGESGGAGCGLVGLGL